MTIQTVQAEVPTMQETTLASQRPRNENRREFWLLFAVTFVLALPVLVLARLMPWRVFGAQSGQRPSVLAEARSAASVAAGYALMG